MRRISRTPTRAPTTAAMIVEVLLGLGVGIRVVGSGLAQVSFMTGCGCPVCGGREGLCEGARERGGVRGREGGERGGGRGGGE